MTTEDIAAEDIAARPVLQDIVQDVACSAAADVPHTGGWLRRLWNQFCRWRACQAAVRHLNSLDDQRLADLGVTRDDIEDAVHRGNPRP